MQLFDVVHIEFCVQDVAIAANFFNRLFGWQCQPSEIEDYWFWKHPAKERQSGGISKCDNPIPPIATTTVYIHVQDLAQTIELAKSLGGHCLVPETKISDELGYFAILAEPNGTQFGIWSKNPSQNPIQNQE